ncbi:MAG: hypothetical protein C4560_06145 [Nitrospiraceae bacterium]|nr:MAG: hypothetical protein C4560_06145 [Nitrospiraceae bacterium]
MEKRAFERIPTSMKADLQCAGTEHHGTIRNLSENGMFISMKKTFFPFDSHLGISIPLREERLDVHGRVSRLVERGDIYDGIGVEILQPPPAYLEFINRLKWNPAKRLKTTARELKTFICGICNHVAFDFAPIECPVCHASIENFEKNPEAVKKPAEDGTLSEIEKKHVPIITVLKEPRLVPERQGIDIHIRVGEVEHLMEKEDYITFIDFYFDDLHVNRKCLGRVSFMCRRMQPAATFHLNTQTSGIITILSNCCAHGSWIAEANI